MSRYGSKHGRPCCRFTLLVLCAALVGCAQAATPTATPRPTPDALDVYIMLMEKYVSPTIIVTLYDMSADDCARILRAAKVIEPPPDLQILHEQAVSGYENICAGKVLLPGSDNVLRSEAYFMIDWGIGLLRDYLDRLAEVGR